jgi:asparagine synthase (glutamine-hydrolysing)
MTALAAVSSFSDRPADANHVCTMLDRQSSRGAHVERLESPGLVVGARWDPEKTGTPLWKGEDVVIVCDSRLDNGPELRRRLELPESISDAELLGRAYLRWPSDWMNHVLGDFAVGLWDRRRRKWILARDTIGVRCLYWARIAGGIALATEPRATIAHRARVEVDRVQLALYLVGEYDEREDTLYAGVHAVPPAHVLVVGEDREECTRYWEPGGRRCAVVGIDAAAEALHAALNEAVRSRMTPHPLAVEFSGGLDSTSVAALACGPSTTHRRPDVMGVTLTFPGLACDERQFSRSLATDRSLPLLEIDPFECPSLLAPVPENAGGDVYFHPTLNFKRLQLRRTAHLGIFVTLTGLGSDQVAHREETHEAADAARSWSLRDLSAIGRVDGLGTVTRGLILAAGLSSPMRLVDARTYLHASMRDAVADVLRARNRRLLRRPHRDLTQLALLACFEHDFGRSLGALDRLAAREGSEFRHPFLDRRVLDLLMSLPHAWVAGRPDEFRKPLLRRAMRSVLPAAILERRSLTQFNPFILRTLLECGEDPRHLLRNGLVCESRLLDDVEVSKVVRNPTSNVNLRRFVNLVGLELWLRHLEMPGENHG